MLLAIAFSIPPRTAWGSTCCPASWSAARPHSASGSNSKTSAGQATPSSVAGSNLLMAIFLHVISGHHSMLSALRRHIRDGSFGPCLPSRRRRRGRSCWQRRCRCSRSGCRRRSLHGSCIQTSLAGSARVNSQAVLDTRGKMATDDDIYIYIYHPQPPHPSCYSSHMHIYMYIYIHSNNFGIDYRVQLVGVTAQDPRALSIMYIVWFSFMYTYIRCAGLIHVYVTIYIYNSSAPGLVCDKVRLFVCIYNHIYVYIDIYI